MLAAPSLPWDSDANDANSLSNYIYTLNSVQNDPRARTADRPRTAKQPWNDHNKMAVTKFSLNKMAGL